MAYQPKWPTKVRSNLESIGIHVPKGREFLGDSECINNVEYNYAEGDGLLTIEFQDGTTYRYRGVSPLLYANLQRVNSKGWFFNKRIRNNYSFERLR